MSTLSVIWSSAARLACSSEGCSPAQLQSCNRFDHRTEALHLCPRCDIFDGDQETIYPVPGDTERRRVHEVMASRHPFATSCRHARIESDRLAAHDFAGEERSSDNCVERRWRS